MNKKSSRRVLPHFHAEQRDDLMRLIDEALYRAKNTGRNCV